MHNRADVAENNLQDVVVKLPRALSARAGEQRQIRVTGRTVREVIADLEQHHPGLAFHICYESGDLRRYVNVFVEQDEVRSLQGLDTPVPHGSTIHILHSVAGG